jgi:hypothetical protein
MIERHSDQVSVGGHLTQACCAVQEILQTELQMQE